MLVVGVNFTPRTSMNMQLSLGQLKLKLGWSGCMDGHVCASDSKSDIISLYLVTGAVKKCINSMEMQFQGFSLWIQSTEIIIIKANLIIAKPGKLPCLIV